MRNSFIQKIKSIIKIGYDLVLPSEKTRVIMNFNIDYFDFIGHKEVYNNYYLRRLAEVSEYNIWYYGEKIEDYRHNFNIRKIANKIYALSTRPNYLGDVIDSLLYFTYISEVFSKEIEATKLKEYTKDIIQYEQVLFGALAQISLRHMMERNIENLKTKELNNLLFSLQNSNLTPLYKVNLIDKYLEYVYLNLEKAKNSAIEILLKSDHNEIYMPDFEDIKKDIEDILTKNKETYSPSLIATPLSQLDITLLEIIYKNSTKEREKTI